jgi:predicted DsbA family dithiol-disulfide isomerase
MNNKNVVTIEMFYTLTCPNCKILKRMLDELEIAAKSELNVHLIDIKMRTSIGY